jgi:hypothetical protein
MSELDKLIKPEVIDDGLFNALQAHSALVGVNTILDIGASSGEGSVQAFLNGMKTNLGAHLYCLDVSIPRFKELEKRVAGNSRVHVFNESSVPLISFPTEKEVADFYKSHTTALNEFPVERVLGWLKQDREYIIEHDIPQNGIRHIKEEFAITDFDIVLIDGSEFTGNAEFAEVYGARFLILDDINAFKNYTNYNRLLLNKRYKLKESDLALRNGFAIFEVIQVPKQVEQTAELPTDDDSKPRNMTQRLKRTKK